MHLSGLLHQALRGASCRARSKDTKELEQLAGFDAVQQRLWDEHRAVLGVKYPQCRNVETPGS